MSSRAVCQTTAYLLKDSLHEVGICDITGYCIPKLQGLPRVKGIEISQQRIFDYSIKTEIKDSSKKYSEEIRVNRRWSFRVRFPVVMKQKLKIAMGLGYDVEKFEFESPDELQNDFHSDLEEKPLRRLNSTIYLVKPFVGTNYLIARTTFSLNGNFNGGVLEDYFRFSSGIIYGKRASPTKTWGVGVNYGYTFGRLSIYPLLQYTEKFNDKTGIEALLPVQVKLWHMASDKDIFYVVGKLEGDNYNLNFENLPEPSLFLEKASINGFVSYAKEIFDFLWFTFSGGLRANFIFDVAKEETFKRNTNPEITNDVGLAPFFRTGIFMVPPRKWVK